MASLQVRKETGHLIIDFYFRGVRYREQTALPDTQGNRKKLQRILEKIEIEIKLGTFDYARFFPGSPRAPKLSDRGVPQPTATPSPVLTETIPSAVVPSAPAVPPEIERPTPTFGEFATTWAAENDIVWRRSHRRTIHDILNAHLLPAFADKAVGRITKSDILAFRSTLAKVPGRKAGTLSPKRINAIMAPLRQILNEAADRFDFTTPYRNIRPLKVAKSDITPFSLEEVQRILATVRPDCRHYHAVRFFTGMRTGEIDGLKWKYVDIAHRQILVRETIVLGEEDTTKTEGSQREIQMNGVVYQALREQERATRGLSQYVFCTREGQPLDHNNVTKRVWYPRLRHRGLAKPRPYQTRRTAATLWLAAGENPLWIASQMGHTSTEMPFKVYGRFAPNLTRQDGSAFERLLLQSGTISSGSAASIPARE
jgi:integrase